MFRMLLYVAAAAALAVPAAAQGPLPPHQPGTICYTQYGWCWIQQSQPGSQCYCATPQGPIYGRVV